MRRALLLIGAFAALALLLAVVGALLPVAHTAAVQLVLDQPPAVTYAAVADVARYPEWRSDVDSVQLLEPPPRTRWRETGPQGTIEFRHAEASPPRTLRTEIQDAREQGFGGSWTWELAPTPTGGTRLTITERGEVYNPLFRLLARFLYPPHATLEQYARDLAARLGDDALPERLLD
jgi:uncharacterized protein YndB with AHSA1/START domain